MNTAAAEPTPAGLKSPGEVPWTRGRWLTLVVLVFAAHVLLLFAFGGRKPAVTRAVTRVPILELADDSSEWVALNDPTLFALPHQRDFAAALGLQMSVSHLPSFRWTEPPRWLSLSTNALGLMFLRFMETNRRSAFELQLKPALKFSTPSLPTAPVLAQDSTFRVEGELAPRLLPSPVSLQDWPYAGVLAPSVVQVLVDAAGHVVSTVLLAPSGYDAADQRALEVARAVRFRPSTNLTIGRMIFNWHTVPPAATNAPVNL